MPEKIATRVLREPSIWEAGVRLLHVGSPEAWRAISDAAEMRHRNRAAVEDCEKAAAKSKRTVRCVLKIEDRKSVVEGKSVSVRVDLGGGRSIKKKTDGKESVITDTDKYSSETKKNTYR